MYGQNDAMDDPDLQTPEQRVRRARRHSTIFKTSGQASGLVAGTKVATAVGWRPVETVSDGDRVLTFDRGLQPLRSVKRGKHWDGDHCCPMTLRPLYVPAEALGNREPMWLLPEQCVIVENETAELLYDDPFTLLHAAHLEGFRGIERLDPPLRLDVIHLEFENDEVVYTNSGALAFCPSLGVVGIGELMSERPADPIYTPLPAEDARRLVKCMIEEDILDGVADTDDRTGVTATYRSACA